MTYKDGNLERLRQLREQLAQVRAEAADLYDDEMSGRGPAGLDDWNMKQLQRARNQLYWAAEALYKMDGLNDKEVT